MYVHLHIYNVARGTFRREGGCKRRTVINAPDGNKMTGNETRESRGIRKQPLPGVPRVTHGFPARLRAIGALGLVCLFAVHAAGQAQAPDPSAPAAAQRSQPQASAGKQASPPRTQAPTGSVRGHVRDSEGNPAADAAVVLRHATEVPGKDGTPTQAIETQTVHTNGKGEYSFTGLAEGTYTLGANRTESERTAAVKVKLGRDETRTIDLVFLSDQSSGKQTAAPGPP